MKKLSAVIIAGNEEHNIGRCLESLQGVADEIIVLNSFSTDQTVSICRSYGVRLYQREWAGYSESKNYANSLSQYPWILSLDADEALSEELRISILRVKEDGAHDAYRVNRLNSYLGKWIRHGSWYPDRKVRLWRSGLAKWEGNVHEKLVFRQKVSIGQLQGDLLHYTLNNHSEQLIQIDKFSTLWAEEAFKNGKSTTLMAMIFKPFARFVKNYFLKGGFRDGHEGFVIARMSSFAVFLRHIKLKALSNQARPKPVSP